LGLSSEEPRFARATRFSPVFVLVSRWFVVLTVVLGVNESVDEGHSSVTRSWIVADNVTFSSAVLGRRWHCADWRRRKRVLVALRHFRFGEFIIACI